MSEVSNDPVFENEVSSESTNEEIENISVHDSRNETSEENENISDVSGNDEFQSGSENQEVPEEDITNETFTETVVNDYYADLSDIKNLFSILIFLLIGFFIGVAFIKGFNK